MNVLMDAFKKCKKNVGWKYSVQRYEANLLPNLNSLRKSLINGTYKQKPFYEFIINERGKTRHIKSLDISDRIVQRALCDNILTPVFSKYLVYDNGASQTDKGISFTRNRLICHIQKYYREYGNEGYILLLDYRKFFDSIPHDKMLDAFRKHIDDEQLMELLKQLIYSFDNKTHVSLGIGSQISQIGGIYYLTKVDNYCKIVKGCKYYGRYMDDSYVIHHDKKFLQDLLKEIIEISNKLGLQINEKKTQICRIDKGFTFMKTRYFVTDSGKIVRKVCKSNIVRERRKIKKLRNKLDDNLITFDEILHNYNSWRGCIIKEYNSKNAINNMDNLHRNCIKRRLMNG